MAITIRKSFPTDAYTLTLLGDVSWKNEYYDILPNGILNEMIKNLDVRVRHLTNQILENNRILVAVDSDKIVGFVFYAKAQNSFYESEAEIRDIYILPEYQKKGIGTKLFNSAILELKKFGFTSMILYCPTLGGSNFFFEKMGGVRKEEVTRTILNYPVLCNIYYYDLSLDNSFSMDNEWNMLYLKAQDNLGLLNIINREIAVVLSDNGNIYLGLGIKNKVCPIESALSNLYIGGDTEVSKILILNRDGKPVLPCGKCRDLLISLGQNKTLILFDYGTLKTITMDELNPYYKDEEKV